MAIPMGIAYGHCLWLLPMAIPMATPMATAYGDAHGHSYGCSYCYSCGFENAIFVEMNYCPKYTF